jgi:LytS/YehU family sensor histidine kinase
LHLGERNAVALREELAVSRMYLDIEQVRFGKRLEVSVDVEPACEDCEVPPLILQPLVENAIKHGVATLVEGGDVAIRCRLQGHEMRISIENSFDPETPAARRNGVGLVNVRKRLEARYGSSAALEVEIEAQRYRAAIRLPCHAGWR